MFCEIQRLFLCIPKNSLKFTKNSLALGIIVWYNKKVNVLTVNLLTFWHQGLAFAKINGGKMEQEKLKAAQEVIHKLIRTSRLHRCAIERESDALGMHCSGHRILMYISRFDTVPSQKELAEKFKISPAAVANTLKKLERDGYVSRCKCADCRDSRYNEISITDKGRCAVLKSREYFSRVDTAAIDGFSDGELDTLVSMLDRIEENLTKISKDTALPLCKECTDMCSDEKGEQQ